jgi:hypothetical protein
MKHADALLEQERAADAVIARAGLKDEQLSERMMRCGMEARVFCPDDEDELRRLARVTLKIDFAKGLME